MKLYVEFVLHSFIYNVICSFMSSRCMYFLYVYAYVKPDNANVVYVANQRERESESEIGGIAQSLKGSVIDKTFSEQNNGRK